MTSSIKNTVTNYTGKPDYQFGDVTVATAGKVWQSIASGCQKGVLKALRAPAPVIQLIFLVNVIRERNDLPQLDPAEGRGRELAIHLSKFTPFECIEFTQALWAEGIDGESVWDIPKFKKFHVIIPYYE
jgi:hypothetical protein